MLTPLYKKHNKISTNIPLMNATLDGTIFDPKQLKNQIKEYNEAIKNNTLSISNQELYEKINSGKVKNPNIFQAYLAAQNKLGNEASYEGFNAALQEDIALMTRSTKGIKILAQHYQSLNGDTAEAAEAQQSFNTMIANANPQVATMIAQDPSAVIRNTTGAIIKSKIAAFGAQAAYTAMNMAMTMGISFLITTGISAIQAAVNKTHDLAQAANELSDEIKKDIDSIDDYKNKIEELRNALASGSLSEEEAYNKRKKLIDIQQELYDTYGKEAEGIDLVDGRLQDQLDLLQNITKEKAQDWLNKNIGDNQAVGKARKELEYVYNESDWGRKNLSAPFSNFAINYGSQLKKLYKENKDQYDEIIKLAQEAGVSVYDTNSEDIKGKDDAIGYTFTVINKTRGETIDAWTKFSESLQKNVLLKDVDLNKLTGQLAEEINDLTTDTYTEALETMKNYAQYMIFSTDELYKTYVDIVTAKSDYEDAIASGDNEKAQEALDTLNELKTGINNLTDDEYIRKELNGMFDSVEKDIQERSFKADVKLGLEVPESEINKIKAAFEGMSDIDVLNIPNNQTATDEQVAAYEKLTQWAGAYGGKVENLVKWLSELGFITPINASETQTTVKTYAALSEELDDVRKKFDKLDNARTTLATGGVLDFSTVDELLKDFPDLYDDIVKVAGGYKIEASAIDDARKALVEKQKTEAQSNIDDLNSNIRSNKDAIAYEKKQLSNYRTIQAYLKTIKRLEADRKSLSGSRENSQEIDKIDSQIVHLRKQLSSVYGITDTTSETYTQISETISEIEKKIKEYQDGIDKNNDAIKQEKFLLDSLENPINKFDENLQSIVSKFQSIKSVIIDIKTQLKKYGELSPETAMSFIENVPDWKDYLNIDNGKITFNSPEDGYRALLENSSGFKDYKADLEAAEKEYTDYETKFKAAAESGKYSGQQLGSMSSELNKLKNNAAEAGEEADLLSKFLEILIDTVSSSDALREFNDTIDELKHSLAMGNITQDTFDAAYANALADFRNKATTPEDKDALREAEETDYQQRIAAAQRHYEDEKLLLDNALEDNLLSYEQYRDKLSALNEKYYGKGTTLGSTEDGKKQYASNLRDIAAQTKNIYDQELKELEQQKTLGLITVEQYWQQRAALGEKYLATEASLADEWKDEQIEIRTTGTKAQYDEALKLLDQEKQMGIIDTNEYWKKREELYEKYLKNETGLHEEATEEKIEIETSGLQEQFEYEHKLLERNYKNGEISTKQYLDSSLSLWEKFYKDKKQFADEDAEAQEQIFEAYKSGVQEQIDAFEAMSEKQTEPYQAEIDALNEVKDKYDEVMDEKIKALQKQKDALEKANEKQKEENDLLEKKQALEKASIKNRIVYVGGGRWEARRDEEEYKKAKQEYDDALKDDQVKIIEKAIEALEEEKEKRDEAIDKEVKALEETVKGIQAPFDALIKVLTSIIAEQHNVDAEFVNQILDSPSGAKEIEAHNAAMAKKRETAKNYGVDLVGDENFTKSEANKKSKEAEKNNKTLSQQMKEMGINIDESQDKVVESNQEVAESNQEVITQLVSEWEEFRKEINELPADFGTEGHTGNVDYNHRVISMNEDDYNTIYGTTLAYSDLVNQFDAYLKENNINNDRLWEICEALWEIAENNPEESFNVTPFKPNGEAIVDINADDDEFFQSLYDYLIKELASGKTLESLDIFMGGNFKSGEEADKDAQLQHEKNEKLYAKGYELLQKFLDVGYDIAQLDGVKYTVTIPTETSQASFDTKITAQNTSASKTNTDATKENTEAVKKMTEVTKKQTTEAAKTDTKSNIITAGNTQLRAGADGKMVEVPMLDDKGNQLAGQNVYALTKSEWEQRHTIGEWKPKGKQSILPDDMTMAEYNKLKAEAAKADMDIEKYYKQQQEKSKQFVPIQDVDTTAISDKLVGNFLSVLQGINPLGTLLYDTINSTMPTFKIDGSETAPAKSQDIPPVVCNITVEGSADEKTVGKMQNMLEKTLLDWEYDLISKIKAQAIKQVHK